MRKRFKLPSPAMTVACISLAVALSGASYAAVTLPRNSVGTPQLKRGAVATAKIKNNAVTGAKVNEATLGTVPSAASAVNAANAAAIADNTVNSAKVVDNSLGGADVNESSLGQVPQAANADTVDGLHAHLLNVVQAPNTSGDVLSAGGLVVHADCTGGDLTLTATTTVNNALTRFNASNGSTGFADFDIGDTLTIVPAGATTTTQGTLTYARPFVNFINQGATVTVVYVAQEDAFGGDNCVVRGTAMSHTPGIDIFIPPIITP